MWGFFILVWMCRVYGECDLVDVVGYYCCVGCQVLVFGDFFVLFGGQFVGWVVFDVGSYVYFDVDDQGGGDQDVFWIDV